MLLHHLAVHQHKIGGCTGARGPLDSTLITYLLGITDITPLPAHYHGKGGMQMISVAEVEDALCSDLACLSFW